MVMEGKLAGGSRRDLPRRTTAKELVQQGVEQAGAHCEIEHGEAAADVISATEAVAQPFTRDANLLRLGGRTDQSEPVFHFVKWKKLLAKTRPKLGPTAFEKRELLA